MADSWERVETDAAKEVCEYFGHYFGFGSCRDCPGGAQYKCESVKAVDLVRRCKKLAGVE